jgi:hypothetical protein
MMLMLVSLLLRSANQDSFTSAADLQWSGLNDPGRRQPCVYIYGSLTDELYQPIKLRVPAIIVTIALW